MKVTEEELRSMKADYVAQAEPDGSWSVECTFDEDDHLQRKFKSLRRDMEAKALDAARKEARDETYRHLEEARGYWARMAKAQEDQATSLREMRGAVCRLPQSSARFPKAAAACLAVLAAVQVVWLALLACGALGSAA